MRYALLLIVLAVIGVPALAEDVVILKDGHEVKGKIVSRTDKEVRIRVDDGEYTFDTDEIKEIRMGAADETPPAPEKKDQSDDGLDVIKLKDGGREFRGKIVAEDETTVTMKTESGALGFEKAVIEWIKKDGKVRRLNTAEASPVPVPPREGREPRPGREGREPRPGREPSPALKRWVETCVAHLGSEDPMVRRSASTALITLGPLARPPLEEAARSDNERLATTARMLLERLPRRGERPERGNQAARLAEMLELTEEQKPKFDEIMKDVTAKRQELMQSMRDGDVPREEMRERWQEIQAGALEALGEVLTEEQLAKYKEMGQRRRGGGRRGR